MDQFNNREIATAILLLVGLSLVLGLGGGAFRRSIAESLQALCSPTVLTVFGAMLVYVAGMTAVLAIVGFWEVSLLKGTIAWSLISATGLVMRFSTRAATKNDFRAVLFDNLKLIVFLQFLINTYTFSLLVELGIGLAVVTVGILNAKATLSSEDRKFLAGPTDWLLAITGFAIFAMALVYAFFDWKNLASWGTVQSVLLVPLLSLFLIPFLYGFTLFMTYERVLLRLIPGNVDNVSLRRYAKRRVLLRCGISLPRVQHLLASHATDLLLVRTEADVDQLLNSHPPWEH